MRIAQIYPGEIPPAAYGGIERMVFWLARELRQQGHDVTVVSSLGGAELDTLGVQHVAYPQSFDELPALLPDIDVLHFHEALPPRYRPHTPYLITEHGNHRKRQPIAPNTVFLSHSHAANHRAEFFVHNGIPLDEYPFCAEKADNMLFMAKLGWRKKNAKTAINLALDAQVRLDVGGGDIWSEPKVKGFWRRRAKSAAAHRLLVSHGEVGGEQKLELLQRSGLLFYAVNWQEPFALAPHEAMATGTPVLCSPNGALPEYIRDGENGYIVSSYQQALDVVRRHRAQSEQAKAAMYQASRQTAFSIGTCAEAYLEAYKTVIEHEFLYPPAQAAKFKYAPGKTTVIKRWFA